MEPTVKFTLTILFILVIVALVVYPRMAGDVSELDQFLRYATHAERNKNLLKAGFSYEGQYLERRTKTGKYQRVQFGDKRMEVSTDDVDFYQQLLSELNTRASQPTTVSHETLGVQTLSFQRQCLTFKPSFAPVKSMCVLSGESTSDEKMLVFLEE
ncbi:MAG: hypothetical protein AAF828_13255 [Bacteroidota bacterium]